jgi:hypothetical protein
VIWHEKDAEGGVALPAPPRADPRTRYRRQGVPEHRITELEGRPRAGPAG